MTVVNGVLAGWAYWTYESEHMPSATLMTNLERIAASRAGNAANHSRKASRFTILPSLQSTNNITGPAARPTIPSRTQSTNNVLEEAPPSTSTVKERHPMRDMLQAFKSRTVLLGALFIFMYQGAEVSISGWVISFLITYRDGDPSHVGYVSSGFWAGITVGRFLLSGPAHKIGEKVFVYGVVVGAAIFELLVWLVPNVIGDAVAVSIVGLLLGPVYPCATVIFSRLIGRKEQVSGLSVISAFGSSGGAISPFTTGILAQAVGTFVLHPIAIGSFAVMLVAWFLMPTVRKRTE